MVSTDALGFCEEKELQSLSDLVLATNEIDWKPAIILSKLYLEKFGKIRLKQIVKNRKIKLDKKIERLSLNEVALFLYTLHEINSKEFTEINKIQSAQNKIVHPKKTSNTIFSGDKANKQYKSLIDIAVQIISRLKNN